VFDRLHVDAVVVPQDQAGLEKVLVMMARQRGASSFCVLHGIAGFRCRGYPGTNADTLVVYGDECGQLYQHSTSVHRVVALGNDELSRLWEGPQARDRRQSRARIGLSYGIDTLVLFAAGTYTGLWPAEEPAEQNKTLQTVCRVASQLREASVLIRLHPSTAAYESVAVKHAIVDYYNRGNLFVDPGLPLEDALAASEVVVTVDSTAGIQAIAARKPLVVFDPLRSDAAGYARGEAGAVVHTEEELLVVLRRLTTDSSFRDQVRERGQRFLSRRVVGVGDGEAGERLLAEIERTCAPPAPVGMA